MHRIIITAIQSACLKASANLTAQIAAKWRSDTPCEFDWQRVAEFALFGLVGATIGYVWQHMLENAFPTRTERLWQPHPADNESLEIKDKIVPPTPTADSSARGISWLNVGYKLIIDQTVGVTMMNTTFLIITNIFRLWSLSLVLDVVHERLWGIVKAAWMIWPAVAVINFVWVPVEFRVLVAACVGFAWNIFLSIISLKK